MGIPGEEQVEVKGTARVEGNWAQPVTKLTVPAVPGSAVNLNVEGRSLTGPLRGFGQMWQKTYRIALTGSTATPGQVVREWKANFPKFWPSGNRFYGAEGGIEAGQVALLNLSGPGGITAPGGQPIVSTGVMVIYADEESFSFMTPQGHMFAGMITFSADSEQNVTSAQVQALIRASDPLFELMFRLGFGHKAEDEFWHGTLRNLAAHVGSSADIVEQRNVLVDSRMQWSEARNIWHNAAIRTAVSMPVRLVQGLRRKQ